MIPHLTIVQLRHRRDKLPRLACSHELVQPRRSLSRLHGHMVRHYAKIQLRIQNRLVIALVRQCDPYRLGTFLSEIRLRDIGNRHLGGIHDAGHKALRPAGVSDGQPHLYRLTRRRYGILDDKSAFVRKETTLHLDLIFAGLCNVKRVAALCKDSRFIRLFQEIRGRHLHACLHPAHLVSKAADIEISASGPQQRQRQEQHRHPACTSCALSPLSSAPSVSSAPWRIQIYRLFSHFRSSPLRRTFVPLSSMVSGTRWTHCVSPAGLFSGIVRPSCPSGKIFRFGSSPHAGSGILRSSGRSFGFGPPSHAGSGAFRSSGRRSGFRPSRRIPSGAFRSSGRICGSGPPWPAAFGVYKAAGGIPGFRAPWPVRIPPRPCCSSVSKRNRIYSI